jgi:hypothetical protein
MSICCGISVQMQTSVVYRSEVTHYYYYFFYIIIIIIT